MHRFLAGLSGGRLVFDGERFVSVLYTCLSNLAHGGQRVATLNWY